MYDHPFIPKEREFFQVEKITEDYIKLVMESNRDQVKNFIASGSGKLDLTGLERCGQYLINTVINFDAQYETIKSQLTALYQKYDAQQQEMKK